MKMYKYKNFNCGFVILCPDQNMNLLKSTANSIIGQYPESPFICVVEGDTNKEDIEEMKKICPVFIGKSTFSSLINVGMDNALGEWNFLVCSGAIVRPKINEKFSLFVDNKKDILYPIVDNRMDFIDSSLNGFFINKETWNEIGHMGDCGPFQIVKLMWGLTAMSYGSKFKAIAGSRFC